MKRETECMNPATPEMAEACRMALMTGVDSGIGPFKLESSPTGLKRSIVDPGLDELASVQELPNGSHRMMARADSFELLPMTEQLHDWGVLNDKNNPCTLFSTHPGVPSIEVACDSLVGFTTGYISLNPVDGNGKEYQLNKKGKKVDPPPQEGKGKPDKPAKKPDSPADKGQYEPAPEQPEEDPAESEAKPEAQPGDVAGQAKVDGDAQEPKEGDGDGEGQSGGEPPPEESDNLVDEQQEQKQGGKPPPPKDPPPPPPKFRVGEAVIASAKSISDHQTSTTGPLNNTPCTVLKIDPDNIVMQRMDNGRYIKGKVESFGLTANHKLKYGGTPISASGTIIFSNPINIEGCPPGYRFLATGETMPKKGFVSSPLGGDKDDIGHPGRKWHRMEKSAVIGPPGMFVWPFSYYIIKLDKPRILSNLMEIGGWKFFVDLLPKKQELKRTV